METKRKNLNDSVLIKDSTQESSYIIFPIKVFLINAHYCVGTNFRLS